MPIVRDSSPHVTRLSWHGAGIPPPPHQRPKASWFNPQHTHTAHRTDTLSCTLQTAQCTLITAALRWFTNTLLNLASLLRITVQGGWMPAPILQSTDELDQGDLVFHQPSFSALIIWFIIWCSTHYYIWCSINHLSHI